MKSDSEAGELEHAKKVTSLTERLIEASLDSNPVIITDHVKIKVESLDTSQVASVAPSDNVKSKIPGGVVACSGTTKVAAAEYSAITYAGKSSPDELKEAPIFSLDIFCNSTKQSVS